MPTEFSARSISSPTCSLCSLSYWLVTLPHNMFDFLFCFLNGHLFSAFTCLFPQNMFLAIINDTYTEVKEELSAQKDELQITDIIKQVRSHARERSPRDARTHPALSTELHEDDHKDEAEKGENIRRPESVEVRIGRHRIQGLPTNSQRVRRGNSERMASEECGL